MMSTGLPPMRPGYRYVCCSRCGVRWNVEPEHDTRYGYICPDCNRRRDKQDAVENNIDYSVYTFHGIWHGVNGWRKDDKNDFS